MLKLRQKSMSNLLFQPYKQANLPFGKKKVVSDKVISTSCNKNQTFREIEKKLAILAKKRYSILSKTPQTNLTVSSQKIATNKPI